MQSVLLFCEELERIDDTHSVLCKAGWLEKVSRLDRLPRRGDGTRFVIRDEAAQAVYRVAWRRSNFGPQPVVSLELVDSSGGPALVEQLLLKAGFRPVELGFDCRRDAYLRLMKQVEQLSADEVRVQVRQGRRRQAALG